MEADRDLPGFEDHAPPDRFCDLVLTGGVTSAVAYPPVIFGLAQAYRLCAIGGSSSGAGSAALAAAAEYRRRLGSAEGYRLLLSRTAKIADTFDGRCGLEWLFQPEPRNRRLFGVMRRAFAGPDGRMRRFRWDLLKGYFGHIGVAGVGVGLVMLTPFYFLDGVCREACRNGYTLIWAMVLFALGFLVGGLLLAVLRVVWDIRRVMDNDYGLCTGLFRDPEAPHAPLTEWLHELIQDIAGLPKDRPLTFADLHRAPGGPDQLLGLPSSEERRSIDLRMFGANISVGRPIMLPQSDDEPALYFRPVELRRLFPSAVVDHMKRAGGRAAPAARARHPGRLRKDAGAQGDEADFFVLPRRDLPVLVASRMSVSFPILFSAVPLWELEPDGLADGARFRRLLFADGGLCSNFPIHLFDRAIPSRPTFGVTLHEVDEEAQADIEQTRRLVRVSERHTERPPDRWSKFDEHRGYLDRLLGFISANVSTLKDWNDAVQADLPGVRERVAYVGLPRNIGGLNILMDTHQIVWLGRAGEEVARKLLRRYSTPEPGAPESVGWREHRWVRLNVFAGAMKETITGLTRAAHASTLTPSLEQQIQDAVQQPPLEGETVLRTAEAADLQRMLDALIELEQSLSTGSTSQPYKPVPRPELRNRSPL